MENATITSSVAGTGIIANDSTKVQEFLAALEAQVRPLRSQTEIVFHFPSCRAP